MKGLEVKLRVVYLRLEFGQVFMRTKIGSEKNRKGERDGGTRAAASPGPTVDRRKPRMSARGWFLWSNTMANS